MRTINKATWDEMSAAAWFVRDNARILGSLKVGAAVLADYGEIFGGCNVEHRFRCHDIHAEVNAISSMVAAGGKRLAAIIVVAKRDNITPCGGCLDWIVELGGTDCLVGVQSAEGCNIDIYTAEEFMPHYPG